MSISFKASPDGTYGEILVNGQVVAKLPVSGNAVIPNLVGTVSQSGGVPTGAVVERGSNANGTYIRFADGTQICTGGGTLPAASNAWAGIYASDGATRAFPAAFSSLPAISSGTQGRSVGDGWPLSDILTTTGVRFYAATGSQGAVLSISYIAIGRWF